MLVPQDPSRETRPMLRDLNRDGLPTNLDVPNSVEPPAKVRRLGAWTVFLPASATPPKG